MTKSMKIGEYNDLRAVRQTDNGIYLEDEKGTEALLPNKFIPDDLYEDDILRVFIFKDHENRLTATTQQPKITLHKFALLEVRDVNEVGAFLDWGLDKDLFVPFKEQPGRMSVGNWYIVYLYLDEQTGRLVGSGRYLKFLNKNMPDYNPGDKVGVLIDNKTELGVNVIVENQFKGLVFENEFFKKVQRGDICEGFVKMVRPDGKIDISLDPVSGFEKISDSAQKVLSLLEKNNGFLPLHDKSDPSEIYTVLEMSKKTFKQAIGGLYKRRYIQLTKDGIRLIARG